jgi:hypothetical protein
MNLNKKRLLILAAFAIAGSMAYQMSAMSLLWWDGISTHVSTTNLASCIPRISQYTSGIRLDDSNATSYTLNVTDALVAKKVTSLTRPFATITVKDANSVELRIVAKNAPSGQDASAVHGFLLEMENSLKKSCANS